MEKIEIKDYLEVSLGEIKAYIFTMKVKDVLPIYYVAVRGRDEEEGAVQRVLNKRRIVSIRDFVLSGNMFFNTFILNWVDKNYPVVVDDKKIVITKVSAAAQVIDGQHRLEGLKQAYEVDSKVGEKPVLIVLTQNLSTKEAATIFLNINTEQKPVPNSLVYDLFGEIKEKDYYLVRATDIATKLHEDPESPYYQCIRMPGAAQGVGKVDLSTVVNALKQYTKEDGVFADARLNDFESEYKIIFNFFYAIRDFYEKEGDWLKNSNAFMCNAGCYAGIDFMCKELLSKCKERMSFEVKTIKELIPLDQAGLLYRNDLKNMQGKEQRNTVYAYLKNILLRDEPDKNEYKF